MLFAAQFGGAGFRHIPRLGCYSAHIFLFEGWVWPGLWGCVACWNRPHIFLQSAAPKAKGNCCYWRHNFQGSLFRTGLLLTTQLGVQQAAAVPLHILKRGMPAGYFPGFARRIVIQRTFSHCRCARIYRNTADFLFSISSCYCLHIFTVYRRFPRVSSTADKENAGLLSTAQFYVQRFSFGFQIAYPPTAQANTTWPAKSSPRPLKKILILPVVIQRTFPKS